MLLGATCVVLLAATSLDGKIETSSSLSSVCQSAGTPTATINSPLSNMRQDIKNHLKQLLQAIRLITDDVKCPTRDQWDFSEICKAVIYKVPDLLSPQQQEQYQQPFLNKNEDDFFDIIAPSMHLSSTNDIPRASLPTDSTLVNDTELPHICESSQDIEKCHVQYSREYYQQNFSPNIPTTIPDFNHFGHTKTMEIKELLWVPGHFCKRPPKILIILRGAPGSGKSHLTHLIEKKELEMGNKMLQILSINVFLKGDDRDLNPEHKTQIMNTVLPQMLLNLLKETVKKKDSKFIIVDAENTDLSFYNQLYQQGMTNGFSVYTIELYQTLDVCMVQSTCNESAWNIEQSILKLAENRVLKHHMLLLANSLYVDYNCLANPKIMQPPTREIIREDIKKARNSRHMREKRFTIRSFNKTDFEKIKFIEVRTKLRACMESKNM